ncbi:MAG: hypothetical protein Q4C74_02210 [Rothia sp. (in: high G+C Gram-positive bacteria)]|nr:hypothetical protein [Rothia sp. (in: high G+C Gram-positive bacteria)]
MAEHVHQVPEKYGEVQGAYHPRIQSYHRRILTVIPPTLLILGILFLLTRRRFALPFTLILLCLALAAVCAIYSVLKPNIVVRTKTHVLRGRTFGWKALELAQVKQTVFTERLAAKKTLKMADGGAKSLRHKGLPAMWVLNDKGKSLLRLDGRIWDHKTMRAIAADISEQTIVYPRINVVQMNKQHPGLITFNELHPGWRSATLTAVSTGALLLLAAVSFLPEETLQRLQLLS